MRMIQPLHLALPEGLEYQRRPGSPLCIRDSREQAQRDLPGQSIPELTRLLPGREDQVKHNFIKLYAHILKELILKAMKAIHEMQDVQKENQNPGLWNNNDEQVHQDNDDELQSLANLLVNHTPDQIVWIITHNMLGFRKDGLVNAFQSAGRIGLQNSPSFSYSALVREAIVLAYSIYYREDVTSVEEYEQGLLSIGTMHMQYRQDNPAECLQNEAR
jgi:hypothetical protein